MRRAKQLLLHTSAMTATSLLMRTIALVFQVYVAGRIGAAGIGLFQLVMSVYTLATTVAVSGVRLAATRLIAQQTGRGDDAAIRRATGCAMGYAAFFGMAALLLLFYLAPAAAAWVGDDRIILSLRVLAFALPFVAASGAMGGYFIAMHQSVKMSLVQLSEQFIRIGCTVLALLRLGGYGLEYACGALTLGMLASEVFSFLALLLLLIARLVYARALVTGALPQTLFSFLVNTACLSVGLGLFNLVPVPPLDGSKVVAVLLPDRAYNWLMRYEQLGMVLLVVIISVGVGSNALNAAIDWVFGLFCRIVGF